MGSTERRNAGLWLLLSGLVLGGLSALLFWVSSNEDWNFGPLIFACLGSLGTVLLIGFSIKSFIAAAS